MLKALELYAEKGIESVSLRAIGAAVGAKNSSAALYHFGSKDELVFAIATEIMAIISPQTENNVSSLEAQESVSIEEILRAVVTPYISMVTDNKWGMWAIRFISQLILEQKYMGKVPFIDEVLRERFERVSKLVYKAMPNVDMKKFQLRAMFGATNVIHGLATLEILKNTPLGDLTPDDNSELVDQFIQYIAGGLTYKTSL